MQTPSIEIDALFALGSSVASNGTDFLIVWSAYHSAGGTFAARVNAAGTVLDPIGVRISTSVSSSYPVVASNGADYFVAWDRNTNIYGIRVDATGAVRDPGGITISADAGIQQFPAIASNGAEYFVTWQDDRNGNWDVFGARVSAAGAVLDPAGIPLATSAGEETSPDVASNGTDYLVVWREERDASKEIRATRVNASGAVLDEAGLTVSSSTLTREEPAVASNGTDYLVTWQAPGAIFSYEEIWASRVSAAGALRDSSSIRLSYSANAQRFQAVASNGKDGLVVWWDFRGGNNIIYASRVSPTGAILDPEGLVIFTGPYYVGEPAVASNGTDYFVAWDYNGGVFGRKVTAAGVVLEPVVKIAAKSTGVPSIASDGTDYLVVYSNAEGGTYRLLATRVSAEVSGAPGFEIATDQNQIYSLNVASNGQEYFVVWESGAAVQGKIYGQRVSATGTALGAAVTLTSAPYPEKPRIASNGTGYFVAWRDGAYEDLTVRGVALSAAGSVLGRVELATAADLQSVTSGGAGYLVV